MNVILVRPRYHTHIISPPLGLGSLAATLASAGHRVGIVDALREGLADTAIVARTRGADLVGVSCMSDFYPEVRRLVRALKDAGSTVVVGGPHATALPGETLAETGADFACVGEGESVLLALADSGAGQSIPGLMTRESPGAFQAAQPPWELDELPWPLWDEIPPRLYDRAPHGGVVKALPLAPIATTRGCPFECSFCFNGRKRLRLRSPQNVVDEVELLVGRHGVREIHFIDDNLTLQREHIEGICNLLLARRLPVHWAAPNGIRVDCADESLFTLMKRSGCYFVSFGIESGDDGILKKAGKGIDVATVEKAVKAAARAGIVTQGFFIYGLPGETEETLEKTLSLALRLPLDKAQFHLLDILPGTRLWEELKGSYEADWEKRSYQEVKYVPPGLTAEVLQRFLSTSFRRFYLRPGPLRCILSLLKARQLPYLLQRLLDFGVFR